MKNLIIIGGGFAGLWAAIAAASQIIKNDANIQITLVSKDPYLNMRPRFYERDPMRLRTPLAATLEPLNIHLVKGSVTSVSAVTQTVDIIQTEGHFISIHFDRLILATGSELKKLPITGVDEYAWNIDSYRAAIALDEHLSSTLTRSNSSGHNTFVIIGAGFSGIELAAEMRDRIAAHSNIETAEKARIILIERASVVGPDLGQNLRPAIEAALREANIEVRPGMSVAALTHKSLTLSNGESIDTKTVILTTGLQASTLGDTLTVERDELGRIKVDENLRIKGISSIFAAGDIASAYVDDEHLALMSCQHAMEMGKFAGYNVVRDLLNRPLRRYQQPDYLSCIDLGQSGALFTSGWERQLQKSGDEGKAIKNQINTQWIYPPTGTREQILAGAALD